MTRRRSAGASRILLLAAAGLTVFWLTLALLHVLGLVLLLAAAGAGGYALGIRRRPVPPQPGGRHPLPHDGRLRSQLAAVLAAATAHADQLAAEVADLTRQRQQLGERLTRCETERAALGRQVTRQARAIADLTEACHAAWDAAASITPRPAPDRQEDAIARLLADPLSGARRIGPR